MASDDFPDLMIVLFDCLRKPLLGDVPWLEIERMPGLAK